ncbi:hypothetical protein LXA43DRAFT_1061435 [Ganoderma leucocontextum]|nr:hypothetical protein LXA43DRAFT_1061435 [Ganoderma leucocontextum]
MLKKFSIRSRCTCRTQSEPTPEPRIAMTSPLLERDTRAIATGIEMPYMFGVGSRYQISGGVDVGGVVARLWVEPVCHLQILGPSTAQASEVGGISIPAKCSDEPLAILTSSTVDGLVTSMYTWTPTRDVLHTSIRSLGTRLVRHQPQNEAQRRFPLPFGISYSGIVRYEEPSCTSAPSPNQFLTASESRTSGVSGVLKFFDESSWQVRPGSWRHPYSVQAATVRSSEGKTEVGLGPALVVQHEAEEDDKSRSMIPDSDESSCVKARGAVSLDLR